MKNNKESLNLASIKRVNQPMRETEDRSTRKMIARVSKILGERFSFEVQPVSMKLDFSDLRFVELRANNGVGEMSINAAMRAIGNPEIAPGQPLEMVSGMCLFGSDGMKGITASGQEVSLVDPTEIQSLTQPVVELIVSPFIQPYEVEAVIKLAEAFNFLVATQNEPVDQDGPSEMNLFLHLPTTEYKLYMLDLQEKGVLNQDQVAELFEIIDLRGEALVNILAKRLNPEINVSVDTPISGLEDVLADPNVTSQEVLEAAEQLPIVGDLIDEYGLGNESPLLKIPEFSYVTGYLGTALKANETQAACLAVDPYEEEPIMRNTASAAKDFGLDINMGVLLLPPKVMTLDGRQGNPALFKHQSNGAGILAELKAILILAREGVENADIITRM